MNPYRVLLFGSRSYRLVHKIRAPLATIIARHPGAVLVVGKCRYGADAIGEGVWRGLGGQVEGHPADWETYGRRAGYIRNAHMASLGADEALGYIGPCVDGKCRQPKPHESHGSTHMLRLVRDAGIPVRVDRIRL